MIVFHSEHPAAIENAHLYHLHVFLLPQLKLAIRPPISYVYTTLCWLQALILALVA